LNTHFKKSITDNFDENEAERILNKIEFNYTPKHASWLNIAEIEINVMDIMCTKRRIGNKNLLIKETDVFCDYRNENNCKISWNFTKGDADEKLSKHYT
jgi:hypothetical protein